MKAKRRAIALGATAFFTLVASGRAQESSRNGVPQDMTSESRFWRLVDATTEFESDPRRQLAALHDELAGLSLTEIEDFEVAFDQEMKRSYSWDLWGRLSSSTVAHRTTDSNTFAVG